MTGGQLRPLVKVFPKLNATEVANTNAAIGLRAPLRSICK